MSSPTTQDTGESLTLGSAAEAIEGLLSGSAPDDTQDPATPPEPEQEELEARQPEESEETEQTDPEEQPSDEEEPEEQPAPEPRKYKVKADGQDLEVTEDELLKGYSRTADYTRKSMELASKRKAFEEQELPQVRAEREALAAAITEYRKAVEAQTPPEPDWDRVQRENPNEFPGLWAAWSKHKADLAALKETEAQATRKVQEDQQAQLQQHIAAEQQRLVEAIPEWKDTAVAKKEAAEIRDFAKGRGFTDEELNSVYDHRLVGLLRMAMQGAKVEQARQAVRQKPPVEKVKPATPGTTAANRRPPVTDATRARQRLAKTGRVDDAAALISLLD